MFQIKQNLDVGIYVKRLLQYTMHNNLCTTIAHNNNKVDLQSFKVVAIYGLRALFRLMLVYLKLTREFILIVLGQNTKICKIRETRCN